MQSQKALFNLDSDVHYLNCAAYGPLLKSSVEAGIAGLKLKENPFKISPKTHFEESNRTRKLFTDLIHCNDSEEIAIIPAASYGMAIVAANLHRIKNIDQKKTVISLKNEFPNDYYAFERVANSLNLQHLTLEMPEDIETVGEVWNRLILESINKETAAIILPHVHWIYGIIFDLEAISIKCKASSTLLIIDGAQSVGVLDFDIYKIKPDALICPSYKWLLGPYSIGFMYLGEFFYDGVPLEETWMNRTNSENFADLTNFDKNYKPKAQRYNMGEFSQFATMPALNQSLSQILEWKISEMHNYIASLSNYAVEKLKGLGCGMVEDKYRAAHLFGITLPKNLNAKTLTEQLTSQKVFLSNRGSAIRISLNVFNTVEDVDALINCVQNSIEP